MYSAYVNTSDSTHYAYLDVDNTYCFDAIESVLLDTIKIVDGCEIILCGDFNARIADRSCVIESVDENDEESVKFGNYPWSQDTKTVSVKSCYNYVTHLRLQF